MVNFTDKRYVPSDYSTHWRFLYLSSSPWDSLSPETYNIELIPINNDFQVFKWKEESHISHLKARND